MKEVIFLPFEASRFFTYKYENDFILEYPSKKILKIDHIKELLINNPLPTLGFLYLRQDTGATNKAPFAEIVIDKVIFPNALENIFDKLIFEYVHSQSNGLCAAFSTVCNKEEVNTDLKNIILKFFEQKGYNDSEILKSIKIRQSASGSKFDKCNSKTLWFNCHILEYFYSPKLIFDNSIINSFHNFLTPYSPYNNSLIYLLPTEIYYLFRLAMKNNADYCSGEIAREKSFNLLQSNFNSYFHTVSLKKFSEQTWRDLFCTAQFNYIDNSGNKYKILFHIIYEKYAATSYTVIDFDTEVHWKINGQTGRLDAYFCLLNNTTNKYIKLYLEFKNFTESLSHVKDITTQPNAITNNNFNYPRYHHQNDDIWYFIAITANTPYCNLNTTLLEDNYINLHWEQLFNILFTKVYPQALASSNVALLDYLNFLINK